MSEQNKVLKSLTKDLFSSEEKTVLSALGKLKTKGDLTVVEPMLNVYLDSEGKIREEIHSMLGELKISKAETPILDLALDEKFKAIRADMLYFVWNSGFQPNDRLNDIVTIGLNGDYMTAVESLTVLDTLEGPFEEPDLMEAQLTVKEFMVTHKEDDRMDLASSIFKKLKELDARIAD
ncbi:MAG: hypothetical protein HKN32_03845 [Flavobacteriales bacterium]|nr:hypothetical protein [Flavobacteriales bacterium]